MWNTLSRSWEYAKISYGIIWDFKQLLVFPILSMAAGLVVLASFAAPLWFSGTIEMWLAAVDAESGTAALTTTEQVLGILVLFTFYLISYTVITFCNVALIACAMRVIDGEVPSVGEGLRLATQRLPQILGWACVAALVGTLLNLLESASDRIGAIVSAVLGSAWTALTFFVVPVLVIDGAGPVTAIGSSVGILKKNWGTALVGQFSLSLLAFLIVLPVILIGVVLVIAAAASGNMVVAALCGGAVASLVILVTAFNSAAETVFRAVLYNYATGHAVPAGVDHRRLDAAFATRSSR